MKVKVIKPFKDKNEDVIRNPGDVFVVTKERHKEINSTKFGVLVVEVAEETKQPRKKK